MKHKFKNKIDAFKAKRKFEKSKEYQRINAKCENLRQRLKEEYSQRKIKELLKGPETYINADGESLDDILAKTGGVMAGRMVRNKTKATSQG